MNMRKWGVAVFCSALLLCVSACVPSSPESNGEGGVASDEPVVAVEWSLDSDCVTCHVDQGSSKEDSSTTAFVHASVECVVCHDDADGLAEVHEDVTTEDGIPTRLKKTEVGEGVCLGCHESKHTSYEVLAEATADSVALTDENGLVVNPHDLPESYGHDDIVCGSCHVMHADQEPSDKAMTTCVGCHHENVFECGTCHSN